MEQKTFTCKASLNSLDEAAKTVDFVYSTNDIDRHNDIVDQNSWDFTNYLKNPVVLFAHDHNSLPIGRTEKIWKEIGANGSESTLGRVKFAVDENPQAKTVWDLVKGGFLNTVSVGFRSKEVEFDDEGIATLKDNELFEVSVVPIPANQMALAKKKGIDIEPVKTKEFEQKELMDDMISLKGRLEDHLDTLEAKANDNDEVDPTPAVEGVHKTTPSKKAVHLLNKAIRQLMK